MNFSALKYDGESLFFGYDAPSDVPLDVLRSWFSYLVAQMQRDAVQAADYEFVTSELLSRRAGES